MLVKTFNETKRQTNKKYFLDDFTRGTTNESIKRIGRQNQHEFGSVLLRRVF
jgi:hypothetical protein